MAIYKKPRPFIDPVSSGWPIFGKHRENFAQKMRLERRYKTRAANNLLIAIKCKKIDCILGVIGIHLDGNRTSDVVPSSLLHIDLVTDFEISLQIFAIPLPSGPVDYLYSNHCHWLHGRFAFTNPGLWGD